MFEEFKKKQGTIEEYKKIKCNNCGQYSSRWEIIKTSLFCPHCGHHLDEELKK